MDTERLCDPRGALGRAPPHSGPAEQRVSSWGSEEELQGVGERGVESGEGEEDEERKEEE